MLVSTRNSRQPATSRVSCRTDWFTAREKSKGFGLGRSGPGNSAPRPCKMSAPRSVSREDWGDSAPPAPSPGCQLPGACEMAGSPEGQRGAGLMRHSKSRCPPAGSDRGTRFPFRIKRVFPFFPAWLTEGFLNWTWRSSIRSVAELAKEETVENSPPRQRRLQVPVPALSRVRRRPRKSSPTSPGTGREHSFLRAPRRPAPVGAAL